MLEVRRLSPDDWELWRNVRLAALADAPDSFGEVLADWVEADESRWRGRLTDVPFHAVALLDGVAAGQVAAVAPDDGNAVKLIAMWVAPRARGRRVGDALIESVLAWAGSVGASEVRLFVWPTNVPAIRLYERAGFVLSEHHRSPHAPDALAFVRTVDQASPR